MPPASPEDSREVGPYRLELLLGRGGMGEVYRAWDPRLERRVAMKRLLAEDDSDGPARERFRREARALAGLGHPAIVQLFDLLEHGGELWMVMELVDGPTLSELLRDGPLDLSRALETSLQIASALSAAHDAGIVHRDLKTDNVMVSRASADSIGHVKLLDFGVARRLPPVRSESALPAEEAETLSLPQALLGTPRAMSPEQARGEEVGARSDLFSLGALIYELLTGSSPFRAASVAETLIRVMTHRQPPAHRLAPAVPETLSALVDQLLEKAPERRPESAAAVAETLWRLRTGSRRWSSARPSAPTLPPAPICASPATSRDEEVVKTLLASELLGASALIVELGDRDAAAILHRHDRRMRRLLALYGGLELEKSAELLLLFDRPLPAVRFALAYHDALRELTEETGIECRARLAIHLGEVVLSRNPPADMARGARPLEVEGLAKLTVKRLLALAESGQTLLTRPVSEMARRSSVGQADLFEWLSHGHHSHGFAEPVEVFEVRSRAPRLAAKEKTRTERVRRESRAEMRPPTLPSERL